MRFFGILTLLVLSLAAIGQGTYIPLGSDNYHLLDRYDIKYGKILPIPHTGVKPYSRFTVGPIAERMANSNLRGNERFDFNRQYLINDNAEWLDSTLSRSEKSLWNVFYTEPATLYKLQVPNFSLRVNPIVQFNLGKEFGESGLTLKNKRGIELRSYIKDRVGLYFRVVENQLIEPVYYQQRVNKDTLFAVPGYGFYKDYRTRGVDFFDARGYVTFNVLEHFDFQFGHDKHFIGNGYRSLMLSNNANNYLFMRINTKVWRINYQNIFAQLTHQYRRGLDRELPKKYAAMHHLNINVTHWLDIGLFEGVILTRSDHFELAYLNPLIFYRSIEQDLGSPDNAFIGFDYKANFLGHGQVYGQVVLDEFNFEQIRARNGWWANKFGFQLGAKYIDVANIENLDLQVEFNTVRPYTYTHSDGTGHSLANYTHYNQQLAHPLGANFREFIGIVRYQPIPKLNLTAKYFNMMYGADTTILLSNWGSNVFASTGPTTVEQEFGNKTGQGIKTKVNLLHVLGSYQIRHNIYADLQLSYRHFNSTKNGRDRSDFFFTLGFRANLPYQTHDF